MATIYLSSTYNDLKACREAVYHTLRQMRHDVIAMEDYVATDQRPTEKCLADVAASDLYIGVFAWRYGYIPLEKNPEYKSITELEYRKAVETGKTCLLFLLDKDAPWPSTAMDAITGESNHGASIKTLRDELTEEKIISFFQTPEELASLVSTAVSNWEKSRIPLDISNLSVSDPTKHSEKVAREVRLRAMLADHSSFMYDRLSSFVGRNKELLDIRERITEKLLSGGYVTITGQAGQGKSSIIAKLVETYGKDQGYDNVAFHFIPFNPGPDHQVSLLRNLMARLIHKYGLPEFYVASESRVALRDYFPRVLAEVSATGAKETILIDGLDQLEEDATGVRDLSFLPNDPPIGIVFVLGTRPNDTLRPLELLKPYHEYQLPNLSRKDFDLILQHRGVKLNKDVADRFYQTMGENALYLDLVAKELAEGGTAAIEELITQLTDNPQHVFSLAIARFKRHPIEWYEVIKPILGVLLVAREPIGARLIRQIIEVDDNRLREGIERLGGLISRDWQQHYSLFHLKLYEYLRQDEKRPMKEYIFASDEEENWHKKLALWCEQGHLQTIWQNAKHDVTEQQRREYARQHYVTHLYHAKEWQRLFAVLDTMQYGHAKMLFDLSTRAYAQDVFLGRQAASWNGWTLEEGIALLPRLWRYTLLLSSLASQADQYPLEAFRLLVLFQREQEALGLAELLTDPIKKAFVLQNIAEQLLASANQDSGWLEILLQACEIASTIKKSDERTRKLSELATVLVQAQEWEIAERAIDMIRGEDERAKALSKLGLALTQAQQWERADKAWSQAEQVIGSIPKKRIYKQVQAAMELALALIQARQWERAEKVISSLWLENLRAQALSKLGLAFTQAQQWERADRVCTEAEQLINSRWWAMPERAHVFSELGLAFTQAQQWERADKAWTQAKQAIGMMSTEDKSAQALSELGLALIQVQQWERAERVISSIKEAGQRAQALSELGLALAQAGQWKQADKTWTQAERAIGLIRTEDKWAPTLSELELVLIRGSISAVSERAKALSKLGLAFTQAQQWERADKTWTQAERVFGMMSTEDKSAQALSELGLALIQVQQWERAERVISSIKEAGQRAQALSELGLALAQAGQWKQADKAWINARQTLGTVAESTARAAALRKLAIALAQTQQWKEAEQVIDSIERDQERAQVGQWEQADKVWTETERVINLIKDMSQRAQVLRELGLALAQVQQQERANRVWTETERVISLIKGADKQTQALSQLGTALAQVGQQERANRVWIETERVISLIKGADKQTQALSQLATMMANAYQWEWAERMVTNIESNQKRAQALSELGKALVQACEYERLLNLIYHTLESAKTRDEALQLFSLTIEVIPRYPELGIALYETFIWVDIFLKER